jgi:hypothetical protein
MDTTNPESTAGPTTSTYVKGSSGAWNGEVEEMKAPRKGIEMTQDIKWVVHARCPYPIVTQLASVWERCMVPVNRMDSCHLGELVERRCWAHDLDGTMLTAVCIFQDRFTPDFRNSNALGLGKLPLRRVASRLRLPQPYSRR